MHACLCLNRHAPARSQPIVTIIMREREEPAPTSKRFLGHMRSFGPAFVGALTPRSLQALVSPRPRSGDKRRREREREGEQGEDGGGSAAHQQAAPSGRQQEVVPSLVPTGHADGGHGIGRMPGAPSASSSGSRKSGCVRTHCTRALQQPGPRPRCHLRFASSDEEDAKVRAVCYGMMVNSGGAGGAEPGGPRSV
jgi:hypothetical protein